jgi:capsular polysaccharide biosynthesis protein
MENQGLAKYQNPLAYLKLFFRRKWFFITPLFIGLVLGIVAAFITPPNYESYTLILVEEQRTLNPLIQDLAVSTSVVQRLQMIREQILGWNNLVDLAKKLNLAKNIQNQVQFEDLINNLKKKIDVNMRTQNIIRLAYKSKDPQEALLLVKNLTDTFIEENMRTVTKETDVAIEFLKEQLQVYKRKLKESEIADLEEQLKKLSLDSTEAHPLVRELKQKIALANRELDSGEYKVAESEKPVTKQMRESLKQELDKITGQESTSGASSYALNVEGSDPNTTLYKMFLMDKLDSSMARDIQVNEQIYNMLLQRLETAKITQRLEASKQGTRYTIIDPPRLPLRPSKPKILVVLIGIFLGGAGGVGLVFGREFIDQSFLDIEDAKQNLDMPILGAISRITTQEEIQREKDKKITLIITGLISSAVLIIAAFLYSLLKK